jgi:hypothetical protein
MGSEASGKGLKETIADEVRGIAVEVYKDVGKPVLGPIGHVAGSAVEVALAPVQLLLDAARLPLAKLKARMERKLGAVPPDRLLPPPANIAGPAAFQYVLLADNDETAELREMFENLLVTSMDRATAKQAHPAFVGMISQMTPDEAWILKSVDKSEYAALTVTDFSGNESNGVPGGLRTMLGRGIGIDESRIPEYISNLDRLGILRIDWNSSTSVDYDAYARIEGLVKADFPHVKDYDRDLRLSSAVICVTALGTQFLKICIATFSSVEPVGVGEHIR